MEKHCEYCKDGADVPILYNNFYFKNIICTIDIDTKKMYLEISGEENQPLGEVSIKMKYCPICGRKLKKVEH